MAANRKMVNTFGEIKKSEWINAAKEWKQNLPCIAYSQQIALNILAHLDENNISQKSFAEAMDVSPQLVSKWLKGGENFTLETIAKIEQTLGISLLKIEVQQSEISLSKKTLPEKKRMYERPVKAVS